MSVEIVSRHSFEHTVPSYGEELVTNGTFDSNITGWTAFSGWQWESDGGGGGWCLHFNTETYLLGQNILTVGKTYHIVFTVGGLTAGSVTVKAGNGDAGAVVNSNSTYEADRLCAGSVTFYITPTWNFDGHIDNVSVKEVL